MLGLTLLRVGRPHGERRRRPPVSGLLGVFGALLGRTLAGRGRALDHLGLGDLTLREVRRAASTVRAGPSPDLAHVLMR